MQGSATAHDHRQTRAPRERRAAERGLATVAGKSARAQSAGTPIGTIAEQVEPLPAAQTRSGARKRTSPSFEGVAGSSLKDTKASGRASRLRVVLPDVASISEVPSSATDSTGGLETDAVKPYLGAKRVKNENRREKQRVVGSQLRAAKSMANLQATLEDGRWTRRLQVRGPDPDSDTLPPMSRIVTRRVASHGDLRAGEPMAVRSSAIP